MPHPVNYDIWPLKQWQVDILTMIAEDYEISEIMWALNISERSVRDCIGKVCVDLGAKNEAQAWMMLQRDGLISPKLPDKRINARKPRRKRRQTVLERQEKLREIRAEKEARPTYTPRPKVEAPVPGIDFD